MSDAVQSYLRGRLDTDVHQKQGTEITLAECRCVQIDAKDVQVGDFLYHYSDQLDSFNLFEIVSLDKEKGTCRVKTIDTDSPEVAYYADGRGYWDGERKLENGYEKFYRPSPQDRERVERVGFESQYMPMFPAYTRRIQRRELFVKLYYKEPDPWWKRFFAYIGGR